VLPGNTEDMNREGAEARLRLLAEAELYRATTVVADGSKGECIPRGWRWPRKCYPP
jgi:hypothetical protein